MIKLETNIKKILFVIYTPYQLFSALNIISDLNKLITIDFIFMHKNLLKYQNILNKFDNIKVFKYEKLYDQPIKSFNKVKIYLSMINQMIKYKKILNEFNNSKEIYDSIFVPSDAVGCNVIFSHFKKNNSNIILNVYDDGMGTYKIGYLDKSKKILYSNISKFILGDYFWKYINEVYCYKPEYIEEIKNIKINKINMNKKIQRLFANDVSNITKKYKGKKIIYLDQGNIKNMFENITVFFDKSKKYCDFNDIIIKTHPRLDPYIPNNNVDIDDSKKPFEAIYSDIDNEEVIIVSLFSTSCITPYMMFNKKPYIIFLGMLNNNSYDKVFKSKIISNTIKEYDNNRIYIPKSFKELDLNLKNIFKNIKNIGVENYEI